MLLHGKKRFVLKISVILALLGLVLTALALSVTPTVFADDSRSAVPQTTAAKVLTQSSYGSALGDDSKVNVDIVLKPKNESGLESYIDSTVTPGSSNYHQYLSTTKFAKNYGQDSKTAKTIIKYFDQYGLHGHLSKSNLVIRMTGTADNFEKAFQTTLYHAKYQGKSFQATKKAPTLPTVYAKVVLGVLGLTTYNSLTTNIQKLPQDLKNPSDTAADSPSSPQSFAKRYDLDALYKQGMTGSGQTMDIVTLAEFNPDDAYTYWKALNIKAPKNRLQVIDVDGGSGWDGSDETSLDVEQSGAIAPKAKINVYVGPNSDTGFFDALDTAVEQDKAAQLSLSWGESETAISQSVSEGYETPVYAQIFNLIFEQAASEGISSFVASGDNGAYDASKDVGTYDLAVDDPADSPFVTAAGGTTLPFSATLSDGTKIDVKNERAWGWDYLYGFFDKHGLDSTPDGLSNYFVGDGGGFSQFFATPNYQNGVSGVNQFASVAYWKPTDAAATGVTRLDPPVSAKGTGTGRNLPDVALNADPETGYSVYYSDGQGQSGTWADQYGGTSFVAPQLNGVSAVLNSGHDDRIGFWNPQIYRFAQSSDSPFTPLNSSVDNDNLYYTGQQGTVYNQATGLGTIDFTKLNLAFSK